MTYLSKLFNLDSNFFSGGVCFDPVTAGIIIVSSSAVVGAGATVASAQQSHVASRRAETRAKGIANERRKQIAKQKEIAEAEEKTQIQKQQEILKSTQGAKSGRRSLLGSSSELGTKETLG